jgi:hypothetical protein
MKNTLSRRSGQKEPVAKRHAAERSQEKSLAIVQVTVLIEASPLSDSLDHAS